MKDDNKLRELYQKVMEGTASPDEEALVARWLDQLKIDDEMDEQTVDEWQGRSMADLRKAITPPVAARSRTSRLIWTSSAAAVLLCFLTWWLASPHKPGEPAVAPEVIYATHSTIGGQRKLLTLADGSRVWLGNASSIRYPKDFQHGKRELFLEGQAFFEVKPDKNKPFWVHANGLDIKVLGTSFNVKSYGDETMQTVTVATGKVSVNPAQDGQEWMLEKGEQVIYHSADKTGIKQMADLSVALSWKNGVLIFRNEPLEEIAEQLERWYGVSIEITSPSIANKQLSLSIKDEPLQRVLKMLSLAGDFRVEIRGSRVTICK
ncbi:FecR family protein [Olivibacter sp. XZL3]|uniref:FecR family protein n=1 Tax=Olivibacter sp. XZL3 TaxID=1735116 RepID=UPI001066C2A4|nr:FecR domain-containing protein [Olivibacter sp. XZL3]